MYSVRTSMSEYIQGVRIPDGRPRPPRVHWQPGSATVTRPGGHGSRRPVSLGVRDGSGHRDGNAGATGAGQVPECQLATLGLGHAGSAVLTVRRQPSQHQQIELLLFYYYTYNFLVE
jgi:hypothetical protein